MQDVVHEATMFSHTDLAPQETFPLHELKAITAGSLITLSLQCTYIV